MSVITLLLAMVCVCACGEKDYNIENQKNTTQIILNAEKHDEMSRVAISGDKNNGFVTRWEVGDRLGAIAMRDGGEPIGIALAAASVSDEGVATFTGTTDVIDTWSSPFIFYTYYPLVEDVPQVTPWSVAGEISSVQTMTAEGSYDPTAAWMVGQAVEMDLSGEDQQVEFTTRFRHLNCFVNLSCREVNNSAVSADDIVRSVRLQVEGETLSGAFTLDTRTGKFTFTDPCDEVCAELPTGMTLGGLSAWLVVNPFELGVDEVLVVEIVTDGYTISKRVSGIEMFFPEREVVTLNLGVDNSCRVTPNAPVERSVTYTVTGKTSVSSSGDVPEASVSEYKQQSYSQGYITTSYSVTLSLEGYDNCCITGISVNLKAKNSDKEAMYAIVIGGDTYYGVLNNSTWSNYSITDFNLAVLSFIPTIIGENETFNITLMGNTGNFYVKSFTIDYIVQ